MRTRFTKLIECLLCVLCVASIARAEDPRVYAGIEIGAGGVKAVTRAFSADGEGTPIANESKFKSSTPVALVSGEFSPEIVKNVFDAIQVVNREIAPAIPLNHRFVVFSSGVVAQADRLGHREVLDKLRSRIESELKLSSELITVQREVQLAFEELTHDSDHSVRSNSLIIDIGSGNTKFGAVIDSRFQVGEVLAGIGSRTDDPEFTSVRENLTTQRTARGFNKFTPKRVYVVGGAFFSLFAHGQPGDLVAKSEGTIAPRFARLHPESLIRYRKWVSEGAADDAPLYLDGLEAFQKSAAQRTSETARKVIPTDQRKKALVLIDTVLEGFNLKPGNDVELVFPVEGHYAWVSGYVRERMQMKNQSQPMNK